MKGAVLWVRRSVLLKSEFTGDFWQESVTSGVRKLPTGLSDVGRTVTGRLKNLIHRFVQGTSL
jgi:hypothetical protein